ncbi:hypothetical protein LTR86_006318 [Recurvomyces mirabilis]|nr:hypothetical protein LTR86_006318 [Recurvomyces mirabilis]
MSTDRMSGGDEVQKKEGKAIRFIMNNGAPNPKRKRKTACSGERPECETCVQNKQECAGYADHASRSSRGHSGPNEDVRRIKAKQTVRLEEQATPELHRAAVSQGQITGKARDRALDELLQRQDARTDSPPDHSQHTRTTASTRTRTKRDAERSLFPGPRNRMPYFRWLGPTAIMPGFKQMVVKVKRQDTSELARSSIDGGQSSPAVNNGSGDPGIPSFLTNTPVGAETEARTPLNLPFYDTSPAPPSELITHLVSTFLTHLGCNYPFLPRERFLRDLEEKQVDAILVDAVCALAARFSTHPLVKQQPLDEGKATPAEYGHAFAQRAKNALVDMFPCPTVAAVQAALLLAYNEFGESRDSGLWMYLGISIRMAQDLGMHTLEGMKYKGRKGPTPKLVKRASHDDGNDDDALTLTISNTTEDGSVRGDQQTLREIEEQKAVEQERVDTFWAVFLLDRVVSSGTGRRSTLRDKEIELSFPDLDEREPASDWPAPFPALIRIVHLYGRVADLLNSIKEPSDITSDTPKKLATMERQATRLYQGLSSRLHFDAVNFQHYMKAGEGTNFVLLHFWFHTLIVLLHQPTLMKTFEGRMLQLFPNSQRLSMSSAKTIADILSYSQLMDAKASLGNPFTTQPIYVAACAFLKETAEQTASSNAQSRASSPTRGLHIDPASYTVKSEGSSGTPNRRSSVAMAEHKAFAKHTLLATAATQHYQLCYKALQSLETYWAGAKYILTVLDQKFEGVGDPLLYTVEEGESAMEQPKPEPAFTSPGWRRKHSWGQQLAPGSNPFFKAQGATHDSTTPGVDPTLAFGWTLTGTMNSPSTNVAGHYASGMKASQQLTPSRPDLPTPDAMSWLSAGLNGQYTFQPPTNPAASTLHNGTGSSISSLLNPDLRDQHQALVNDMHFTSGQQQPHHHQDPNMPLYNPFQFSNGNVMQDYGDMMIQTRDVDMSALDFGLDMPWFDAFPPHDRAERF